MAHGTSLGMKGIYSSGSDQLLLTIAFIRETQVSQWHMMRLRMREEIIATKFVASIPELSEAHIPEGHIVFHVPQQIV
jgi:hypothetical protein